MRQKLVERAIRNYDNEIYLLELNYEAEYQELFNNDSGHVNADMLASLNRRTEAKRKAIKQTLTDAIRAIDSDNGQMV